MREINPINFEEITQRQTPGFHVKYVILPLSVTCVKFVKSTGKFHMESMHFLHFHPQVYISHPIVGVVSCQECLQFDNAMNDKLQTTCKSSKHLHLTLTSVA